MGFASKVASLVRTDPELVDEEFGDGLRIGWGDPVEERFEFGGEFFGEDAGARCDELTELDVGGAELLESGADLTRDAALGRGPQLYRIGGGVEQEPADAGGADEPGGGGAPQFVQP